MKRKPKIYCLVGHIASGKSTYCRNAAKEGYIICNDDNVVNLVHGGDYTLYNKSNKIIYKSIENQILSSAVAMGKSVIIDRGVDVGVSSRRRWLALASSFDIACEAIMFPVDKPEVHARRRFESDNRNHPLEYWQYVVECHAKRYVMPSKEEGFDAVHYITWDEIQKGKIIV